LPKWGWKDKVEVMEVKENERLVWRFIDEVWRSEWDNSIFTFELSEEKDVDHDM